MVFELQIPQLAALGVAKVADVVVRYVSVGEGEGDGAGEIAAHELSIPINVNMASADEAAGAGPDSEVTEEVIVCKSARAQEQARKKADEGDFDGARSLLTDAANDLRKRATGSNKADELLLQATDLEESANMMMPGTYGSTVSKNMLYKSRGVQRRRRKS